MFHRRVVLIAAAVLCLLPTFARAATATTNDANEVYQYFVPGPGQKNLGAYLWVPPETKVIRAVMVGLHNGLPISILQHPAVRRVCAAQGIAQILLTPWSEDIGKVMLKDLAYDFTDPARTAIFDGYLKALADLSHHPELNVAPLVPLAHSAFASFPCEVAARDPERCLMAIPIKAGFPNVYQSYAKGGHAGKPLPNLNLANVPILLCTSLNQATVPGAWKSKALPYGSGKSGHPLLYRDDTDTNPGDTYKPGNELCGLNWEMLSCHFDMSEREYTFLADYLDAVCRLRLPATPPTPGERTILKPLLLNSGWLIDAFYSNHALHDGSYHEPAPYTAYTGSKSRAYWYPTEALAKTIAERMTSEVAKQFEVFTLKDKAGAPLSLAESPQVTLPDPPTWVEGDGAFTLRIYQYTTPPLICTTQGKHGEDGHKLENVLFPGKTTLPVSSRPVQVDINSSAVELLHQDGLAFTFRLRPHRLAPDPGGASGACLRFYQTGDATYAWSGRNVFWYWWLNGQKIPGIKDQTITFPEIGDIARGTTRVTLAATASSGRQVGYFVRNGPAVIEGDELVVTQVPAGDPGPIAITVGAYQVGLWQKEGGFRAANTVYRTCTLKP
jgi:hypothetical protein